MTVRRSRRQKKSAHVTKEDSDRPFDVYEFESENSHLSGPLTRPGFDHVARGSSVSARVARSCYRSWRLAARYLHNETQLSSTRKDEAAVANSRAAQADERGRVLLNALRRIQAMSAEIALATLGEDAFESVQVNLGRLMQVVDDAIDSESARIPRALSAVGSYAEQPVNSTTIQKAGG